ncbi:expressed unknown protein [Seminavis robusta]|uniref:Uncharacterized protein n=1 Tax=Seminavis robusta TaxID=568900 RepID=A0A9N8HTF2_9STRA|nr:expressed unknown protein [Seminavis robusta]|eukprot:Sro1578_g283660.1 n/a (168) ;mRNA; r:21507-22097
MMTLMLSEIQSQMGTKPFGEDVKAVRSDWLSTKPSKIMLILAPHHAKKKPKKPRKPKHSQRRSRKIVRRIPKTRVKRINTTHFRSLTAAVTAASTTVITQQPPPRREMGGKPKVKMKPPPIRNRIPKVFPAQPVVTNQDTVSAITARPHLDMIPRSRRKPWPRLRRK